MKPFGKLRDIQIAAEDGVILYAAGESLPEKNVVIQSLVESISAKKYEWLVELIPSYDSVMLVFDMWQADHHSVYCALSQLQLDASTDKPKGLHHSLPVWYGAPQANDLDQIALHTGLSKEAIINLHSNITYRAYAVGFAPGFAYLGELDPALTVPRMAKPRTKVPAGAVAIADRQTAVYPSESPGGWHLLGLCPIPLYSPKDGARVLISAGDTVSFTAIDQTTFLQLAAQHGLLWDKG
ncbi:5-oxoprolinase subunit PxpB [Aestuariibacter sp. GS-14]|uniref:5-oxoprolinase subunit PxpB n=1 Tax=Aestuariibacter sp. GS-14 TaxID=2590670 RepID=UPI00112C69BB|nr:5-oxoprolinase subunit PxpB [Aestuariibacter sp. GS-14]TPV59823.1 5-oxoprolinase subunit PxpB [Aestuariibacter sp. GS-14]